MLMSVTRMLGQNTYYFLMSGLRHGDPGFSFPVIYGFESNASNITIPSVGITRSSSLIQDYELGSTNVDRADVFTITVVADTDGQRDDISERVKEIFDGSRKEFLDFNQGFDGGQDSLGTIFYDFINMRVIRNMAERMKSKTHRIDIDISAQYIYDIGT